MLIAGNYYTLTVGRISDYGLYLTDEEGNEVLLPNRYVSIENKVGDPIRVFVYHDSEDRLVATTETPLATVGEVAFLKVVDKTIHGAFLDWGLEAKHLFLPNRNQPFRFEIGRSYPVYLYTDNVSGRVVATARLNGPIGNNELSVRERDEVQLMVTQENELGYRVVVNNRHWGMLYRNQLFRPVAVGDRLQGYVTRITDDRRIDVSLQQQGYDEVKKSADRLLDLLWQNGGSLALNDDSSPETVHRMTGMSKKVFKRSAGYLMKQGSITISAEGIAVTKELRSSE